MKQAIAIRTFRRSDNKKIVHSGRAFEAAPGYVDELVRNRLAREVAAAPGAPENKANPSPAGGAEQPSSASPAAQASPQMTAKPSRRGGSRKKKGDE